MINGRQSRPQMWCTILIYLPNKYAITVSNKTIETILFTSRWRRYFNLMVTFLASGLWHGANWTYVLWGGIHGIYQIIGEVLRPIKDRLYPFIGIRMNTISYKVGQVIATFILTDIAWIFFRSENIASAFGYIRNIFTRWNPWAIADTIHLPKKLP